MKFVKIKAGKFIMGSPKYEVGRFDDEAQREIIIEKDFELQTTPVTQKEWKTIMGNNPSYFKGDNLPVESISYNQVLEFIDKLNKKQGEHVYCLPTEEEWEYACRAGTTGPTPFKEGRLKTYVHYNNSNPIDVGSKKPNKWGLYDMLGNVWEMTSGLYNGTSAYRVIRGGGWGNGVRSVRSAQRLSVTPGRVDDVVGFRLARTKNSSTCLTIPVENLIVDSSIEILKKLNKIQKQLDDIKKKIK